MSWMAWTFPTALFFSTIVVILVLMTVWEIKCPSIARRGFLPLVTTRGDRLFIGLLGSAYIHLIWIFLTETTLWGAFAVAIIWAVSILRWG